MAQRRMFSKKITETDLFLDMPMSAQCLYFHLNMSADDEGFIGNAKTIRRMVGASEDDFKLLMAKEFIIPFESGVVVIKDWKVHNYIRSDRYKETIYKEEKSQLSQNENGQYQVGMTSGIPLVHQRDTQDRLGKDRLGKDRGVESQESKYPSAAQTYYENHIGMIKPIILEDLQFYGEKFIEADEIIKRAIDIAISRSAKNWGYVKAILRGWQQEGLETLEQVDTHEKGDNKNQERSFSIDDL